MLRVIPVVIGKSSRPFATLGVQSDAVSRALSGNRESVNERREDFWSAKDRLEKQFGLKLTQDVFEKHQQKLYDEKQEKKK